MGGRRRRRRRSIGLLGHEREQQTVKEQLDGEALEGRGRGRRFAYVCGRTTMGACRPQWINAR